MNINYPLKFKPIFKERIWGGEKLKSKLNKASTAKNIGESWEISDVKGEPSIVVNGDLKGLTLEELIATYKEGFLGNHVYRKFGNKFPLLIKFIDAKTPLSIQLHPSNELAKARHQSFGKTEMWYIIQADPEASLVVGFKKETTKSSYLEHLKNCSLLEILNKEKVKKGDVYFIPTGRVHAIGAGVLLAEIQQTSDITYRIYDWDRTDDKGNSRELHTELAVDAIDYKALTEYKTSYTVNLNKASKIIDCQYFTTNLLKFNKSLDIDNSLKDSFVIYMCVLGKVSLIYGDNRQETLALGETILMPSNLKKFRLQTSETAELLEVYIKNDEL